MTKLFIVESAGKIKTISKILGSGFNVQASVGHIRDLPKREIGIDTERWTAKYEATNAKSIANLRKHAQSASEVILATDNDREGEAIAWHICKVLNLPPQTTTRVFFTEITKSAISKALASATTVDMKKVAAQEARRFLDRILGYRVSPALSDSLPNYTGLSAGRVQSVALKLVVLRELAIRDFIVTNHYELVGTFIEGGVSFDAVWDFKQHFKDTRVPNNINNGKADYFTDRKYLEGLASSLESNPDCKIINIEKTASKSKAPAPFITSTFQMACSSKFRYSPKKSMEIAQKLYEAGHITYMRTDCPNLSDDALKLCNEAIQRWCTQRNLDPSKYILSTPNTWKSKGGAQEAHEAIRPTDFTLDSTTISDAEQRKVYELIFMRTVACQMSNALFDVTKVDIATKAGCDGRKVVLTAKGRVKRFGGWKDFGSEDDFDADKDNEKEAQLPQLHDGQNLKLTEVGLAEKKTSPPARYVEASLVRALENEGIGRPATYASIMSTLFAREYIEVIDKKSGKLAASKKGQKVIEMLDNKFDFMDVKFTKGTEDMLDEVAGGKLPFKVFMSDFYEGFESQAEDFISFAEKVSGAETCPTCNERKLKKIRNKKGSGFTWLCSGYFEKVCRGIYPDDGGKPDLDAKPTEQTSHPCPSCNQGLYRFYRDKKFTFGCKPCKVYIPGDDVKPDYDIYKVQKSIRDNAPLCPACEKGKVLKRSYNGSDFFGCDNYPDCKTSFAINSDGGPDIEGYFDKLKAIEKADTCPECGTGKLLKRNGRFGDYFACNAYPSCSTTLKVNSNGDPDIEAYNQDKQEMSKYPDCKKCKKGKMVPRKGRKGDFVSCNRYPKCKNTE